jgi:sulfur carrier protein ThiS
MQISITILPENTKKNLEVSSGTLIIDMLKSLQLSPDALIVLRNNKPIPVDEEVQKDDQLSILKVASGG